MEQSTLAEILGVEKEIRAQLDAEREQASRWLENARREIEQAHQADLAHLQAEAQLCRDAGLRAARDRASTIVQAAESAAAEQGLLTDDALRALIRRHIAAILPEDVR
jgi:flagellar biosynthesis/type III secretory pathway protein FliH